MALCRYACRGAVSLMELAAGRLYAPTCLTQARCTTLLSGPFICGCSGCTDCMPLAASGSCACMAMVIQQALHGRHIFAVEAVTVSFAWLARPHAGVKGHLRVGTWSLGWIQLCFIFYYYCHGHYCHGQDYSHGVCPTDSCHKLHLASTGW